MLSHMILSVDYSDDWERAINQLPALIKRLGIERLTLVYIIEPHKRHHIEDSEGAVKRKLQGMSEEFSEQWQLPVDYEVGHGFVGSRMFEIARLHNADGVICCNTHHSAGRELFFGNNAMNMARVAQRPLLILPVEGHPASPGSPLFLATDGSTNARHAQELFVELVTAGNGGQVVWVRPEDAPPQADEVDALVRDITNRNRDVQAKVLVGRPARELVDLIRDSKPALTLIGKRGTTPIPEMLLGHTSETVVRESLRPVLLVP